MLDMLTLKAENLGVVENLKTHGITITLSGIIIVFSMLVLLVIVMAVFGAVMTRIGNKPKKEKQPKVKKKTDLKNTAGSDDEGEVLAAISAAVMMMDEEVVAAISAAVNMMYEGTGKSPIIRSIKPSTKQSRSAWKTAGVLNNTRSF
ncbi:MAG: OadG family protein [Clostridia bacterium]|nr:OadG family protein [Clostridia bacterium]